MLDTFKRDPECDDFKSVHDPGAVISEIHFTKRELELLVLIMEGSSNEEIAQMLMISTETVKRYIHNIYQKLEVKNRVQAVKKIKENHLIRRCLL
ncbi:response regulator transcription factor [Paenibacillus glucanolyticus]|uniref:response regulator transcription factor n=2 Tax=Paenibacillus TaxID=44249 RepID=UPI0011651B16|nr:hypothetical protein B9D94_15870 [Paenibacillus sp. Cedars]